MAQDDDRLAEEAFLQARKLEPSERSQLLDVLCSGREKVRWRVESLLAADDELRGVRDLSTLEGPEAPGGGGADGPDSTAAAPFATADPDLERIGPYEIRGVLGEGGMGVVYVADQVEPVRRRVALKLIKLGMDTKEVVARFEAERQALAMLSHPNVAAVLDAGATASGRPYFVMEYVPGVVITDYCESKQLTIAERLELFIVVCEAIQHAHQKGLIHRDIKPSNVLVMDLDGQRVPKVIDFGIAKATSHRLTEKTVFTEMGLMIGTPEYMSPEQAEMNALDVDTRTDIYSLGVLLYELLVGRLPFEFHRIRSGGLLELQRTILYEHPPKPSTRLAQIEGGDGGVARARRTSLRALVRSLRGDLDWITMKAMDKDRMRRYATVSELAADVRRHLRGEAVAAAPPGTVYRLRKFVSRHSRATAIAMVATVFFALLTGWISTNYRDARRHRLAAYEPTVLDALEKIQTADWNWLVEEKGDAATGSARWPDARLEDLTTGVDRAPLERTAAALGEIAGALPDRVDAWYHRARSLLLLGEDEAAGEDLDRALESDPEFVPAAVLRARTLRSRGDDASADAEVARIERSVRSPWARTWWLAHRASADERWSEAIEAWGTLLTMDRSRYLGAALEILSRRGAARLEARDYLGAVSDFATVQSRWPAAPAPAFRLAEAYYLSGRKEMADQTLLELHERSSFKQGVALLAAELYRDLGVLTRGLEWISRLTDAPIRERMRASLLLEFGMMRDGFAAARAAVHLAPDDPAALLLLSYGFGATRDLEGALDAVEQALRSRPDWSAALHRKARILQGQGRLEEAVGVYTKSLELDPADAESARDLVWLVRREPTLDFSGYSHRLAALLPAAERSGVDRESVWNLSEVTALTLVASRDPKELDRAREYATVAVEKTGGKDPAPLTSLARIQFARGEHRDAILTLERAARLPGAPDDLSARLAKYRQSVEPDLVSSDSIDAAIEAVAHRNRRALTLLEVLGSGDDSAIRKAAADGARLLGIDDLEAALGRVASARGLALDPSREPGEVAPVPAPFDVMSCDFERDVDERWSVRRLEESPSGAARFLGPFADDESVRLSLAGLPDHRSVKLSFDLLLMGEWAGSGGPSGPDGLEIEVDGRTLLSTTFSATLRDPARPALPPQAYPDDARSGLPHPPGTGADSTWTLGYPQGIPDATYTLAFTIPHSRSALEVRFSGAGTPDPEEKWGLDNVDVRTTGAIERTTPDELRSLWIDLSRATAFASAYWRLVATGTEGALFLRERIQAAVTASEDGFEAFRALAARDRPGSVAYLDARLLQEVDRHSQALARFREAMGGALWPVEVVRRYAECFVTADRIQAAKALLLRALSPDSGVSGETDRLWDLWHTLSLDDLATNPRGVLASIPSARAGGRGADFARALEEVTEEGVLRINCGGGEYRDVGGAGWGHDRFFTSGVEATGGLFADRFHAHIHGTEDDELYLTRRRFPGTRTRPPGYSIPLPRGRYRVGLHFAEVFSRFAGLRRSDVLLEGRVSLWKHEPLQAGFRTAMVHFEEVDVRDGFLDVQFVARRRDPEISAIEVRRLGASLDLGDTDTGFGLRHRWSDGGEGANRSEPCGPPDDRRSARCSEKGARCFFFEVTDPSLRDVRQCWIRGSFYDDPGFAGDPVRVGLQYTSAASRGPFDPSTFTDHPDGCVLSGRGRWVSHTWRIEDAGFRNFMHLEADFRFVFPDVGLCLDRVSVGVGTPPE